MEESLWLELQRLRPQIRQRWETRLRAQPPVSPLAHPDSLVHMMDWTLDQILRSLRKASPKPRGRLGVRNCAEVVRCQCGLNPLLAYFRTGELALMESLLSLKATSLDDLALDEVKASLNAVAKKEIEILCSLCRHREKAPASTAVVTVA